MDRSGAQHPQEMATETLGSMMVCPNTQQVEKKPKPQLEEALKCPRCDSNNTKFCYYNNYSLSQPRYFCKSCKRYWTQGGTLRNVPVGGGCRKTKRSPSKGSQDQPITTMNIMPNPHYSNDLSLAFSGPHSEGLGNPNFQRDAAAMFLDAPPNGFFQNLCYGNGNGDLGNGRGEEGEENRVLWGIPWQNMGGGDGNWMGNFDTSGRESWNGGAASFNWHGIVNGPLV